jgi:hypothetical protein
LLDPAEELPALKNGSTWVSRFRNIVDYLRQYSNGVWDLDRDLSALEKADNVAYARFAIPLGRCHTTNDQTTVSPPLSNPAPKPSSTYPST